MEIVILQGNTLESLSYPEMDWKTISENFRARYMFSSTLFRHTHTHRARGSILPHRRASGLPLSLSSSSYKSVACRVPPASSQHSHLCARLIVLALLSHCLPLIGVGINSPLYLSCLVIALLPLPGSSSSAMSTPCPWLCRLLGSLAGTLFILTYTDSILAGSMTGRGSVLFGGRVFEWHIHWSVSLASTCLVRALS